jgi:hypothetical protein
MNEKLLKPLKLHKLFTSSPEPYDDWATIDMLADLVREFSLITFTYIIPIIYIISFTHHERACWQPIFVVISFLRISLLNFPFQDEPDGGLVCWGLSMKFGWITNAMGRVAK